MLCTLLVAAVAFATEPLVASAQDSTVVARAQDTTAASPPDTVAPVLFTADSAIHFTLRANFRALGGHRTRPSGVHSATITYTDGATSREMPLRVRSRAHWRLKNCDMSPLRLSFQKQHARETIVAGLDRGRLVMHCRGGVEYEQYVLQELQLYRIYNLLTPFSHRARLARVTYLDSAGGRDQPAPARYSNRAREISSPVA